MENLNGYVAPGFEPIRDAFESNFDEDLELGAGFTMIRDGEIVVNLVGGWTDRRKSSPWQMDTLVPVYSTSKAISALVVARVISEAEGVGYDTLVTDIWPEFGAHGKDKLTISDVMSHQGGLSGFKHEIDPAIWLDPAKTAAALADAEPLWSPVPDGSSGYHPSTWGYIAWEIVMRLTGKTLGTVLADEFTHTGQAHAFDKIDFWIGTPASEHHRIADIQRPRELPKLGEMNDVKKTAFLTKWAGPDRGGPEWRETEIPSANGHGTAEAVARLYAAYATGGTLGDVEIADAETWADFLKIRASGQDRVLPFEVSFASGPMKNTLGFYGRNSASFGHSGWGGSAAFGDPDAGISCAYVMNRQSSHLLGDPRPTRLFNAVYDCLD
ncbi:MAG: esterase [Ponticaulis sp.]|nr:esterase [Ponticaulis sp.]|tara:strand:+ start:79609 stop:80757 length:1149 start_codon:yes stop_codon:yes gene_type:complete